MCIDIKQQLPLQLEITMVVLAEATLEVLQLLLWAGQEREEESEVRSVFKQEAPFGVS